MKVMSNLRVEYMQLINKTILIDKLIMKDFFRFFFVFYLRNGIFFLEKVKFKSELKKNRNSRITKCMFFFSFFN